MRDAVKNKKRCKRHRTPTQDPSRAGWAGRAGAVAARGQLRTCASRDAPVARLALTLALAVRGAVVLRCGYIQAGGRVYQGEDAVRWGGHRRQQKKRAVCSVLRSPRTEHAARFQRSGAVPCRACVRGRDNRAGGLTLRTARAAALLPRRASAPSSHACGCGCARCSRCTTLAAAALRRTTWGSCVIPAARQSQATAQHEWWGS